MRLFRITCIVDERKLADVHWNLAGKVSNFESVPIINAKQGKGGSIKARTPGGTLRELILDEMNKRGEMTVHEMVETISAQGKSGQGAYVLRDHLVQQGFIEAVKGKEHTYRLKTAGGQRRSKPKPKPKPKGKKSKQRKKGVLSQVREAIKRDGEITTPQARALSIALGATNQAAYSALSFLKNQGVIRPVKGKAATYEYVH